MVGGSTPGPFCGFNLFMKVVLLIARGIIEGENHVPLCQLLYKVIMRGALQSTTELPYKYHID